MNSGQQQEQQLRNSNSNSNCNNNCNCSSNNKQRPAFYCLVRKFSPARASGRPTQLGSAGRALLSGALLAATCLRVGQFVCPFVRARAHTLTHPRAMLLHNRGARAYKGRDRRFDAKRAAGLPSLLASRRGGLLSARMQSRWKRIQPNRMMTLGTRLRPRAEFTFGATRPPRPTRGGRVVKLCIS